MAQMVYQTDGKELDDLAEEFDVPRLDAYLIAANLYGAQTDLPYPRSRFVLSPDGFESTEKYQLILPLDNAESPFRLESSHLELGGETVGLVERAENDDVVIAYPRAGGAAMTINSYARSQCTGCIFCPNVVEDAADDRLTSRGELVAFLSLACADHGWESLASVERLTVSSGCFINEPAAIEHLVDLRWAAEQLDFDGTIHILSSVIRSAAGLKELRSEAGPFHLSITLECFDRRELLLKDSKSSLSVDGASELLDACREADVIGDFTYVVGLDSFESACEHVIPLLAKCTAFPKLQVFQAHNAYMRRAAAKDLDMRYLLAFRRHIEERRSEFGVRPLSWENYRPLWYSRFADEPVQGPRI